MKTCTTCNEEKELSCFQIRRASKDGLTASCKSCLSIYDKKRANNPERVQARQDYAKTKNGKDSIVKSKKKWIMNNQTKRIAHNIVSNSIRDKKLFKEPCVICGAYDFVNAHHDDYSKPLNVRWLCPKHHHEWHSKNGPGLNA